MPDPTAWICNVCGYAAPVIPMARDCEKQHEQEAEQWATRAEPTDTDVTK